MEIRLSVVLLTMLLVAAAALSASRPTAVMERRDPDDLQALAELEDAASLARGDLGMARRLATTYLRLGQPGLAIATVRSSPPELARDPLLTHRLSQAYEASGRVDDALSTAQLARARCRSAVGAPPLCSASTQAALEMHEEALGMLVRWGVQEPRRDTRTALAYRLAQRTARIASLGLGTPAE